MLNVFFFFFFFSDGRLESQDLDATQDELPPAHTYARTKGFLQAVQYWWRARGGAKRLNDSDDGDVEFGRNGRANSVKARGKAGKWNEDEVDQLKTGTAAPGSYGVTDDVLAHATFAGGWQVTCLVLCAEWH